MNKKLALNSLLFNGGPGSGNHTPGQGRGVGKPSGGSSSSGSKSSSKGSKSIKQQASERLEQDRQREKRVREDKSSSMYVVGSVMKDRIQSEVDYYIADNFNESVAKDIKGSISISEISDSVLGDNIEFGVNWSAMGTQNEKFASEFAKALSKAAELAYEGTKEYDKELRSRRK